MLLEDKELPDEPRVWQGTSDLQCCCYVWKVSPHVYCKSKLQKQQAAMIQRITGWVR